MNTLNELFLIRTEDLGGNQRIYTSYEEYLNHNFLFVSKGSKEDLYLEVGESNYPFEINLPPKLPTSFEHQFGRIRYWVEVNVDIPWLD